MPKECTFKNLTNKLKENKHFILPGITWTFIGWILWVIAKTCPSLHYLYNLNNSMAALLGLVGTIQVYRFGVPSRTESDNRICLALESSDEEDEAQERITQQYRNKAATGLGLIAASFLISGFLTSP